MLIFLSTAAINASASMAPSRYWAVKSLISARPDRSSPKYRHARRYWT